MSREVANACDLLALTLRVIDFDRKIRTVKTADKRLRAIESELLNDVGADVWRGRGGWYSSVDGHADRFARRLGMITVAALWLPAEETI